MPLDYYNPINDELSLSNDGRSLPRPTKKQKQAAGAVLLTVGSISTIILIAYLSLRHKPGINNHKAHTHTCSPTPSLSPSILETGSSSSSRTSSPRVTFTETGSHSLTRSEETDTDSETNGLSRSNSGSGSLTSTRLFSLTSSAGATASRPLSQTSTKLVSPTHTVEMTPTMTDDGPRVSIMISATGPIPIPPAPAGGGYIHCYDVPALSQQILTTLGSLGFNPAECQTAFDNTLAVCKTLGPACQKPTSEVVANLTTGFSKEYQEMFNALITANCGNGGVTVKTPKNKHFWTLLPSKSLKRQEQRELRNHSAEVNHTHGKGR
ncbi:MAG: hypothetical protein ACD_42C00621G0004 [uncultured bacterium]|nr:MAG: hypothetical protein ACD_42C00621G0004 [uncultured bacterium]